MTEDRLTHLDETGAAHMVDISGKDITTREAIACGRILMTTGTRDLIAGGALKKGDALATARLAGIMAAKKTSGLIPLCHPLPLSKVAIALEPVDDGYEITARIRTTGRTGVEMEALTAVSVAALTLYDMAKAVEKTMRITDIRLLEKTGGKSGDFRVEDI